MSKNLFFYKELKKEKIPLVELLGNESLFHAVPEDWHLILIDVENSTQAIQEGKQIQLNIGRGQGVFIGQEYRVSYRADIIDNSGNLLTNFVISPYRVRITKVYENSAIAESLDKDFMSNVQVNDVIELKDWSTDW